MNIGVNSADASFSDLSMDMDMLEKNIESFPYSSYARYMLLLHYKRNGHSDFEKAAKKTMLYFNNPYWLQFQLSQVENIEANDSSNNQAAGSNHFAVSTEEQIETANNRENTFDKEQENQSQDFSEKESGIQNNFKDDGENKKIIFPDTSSEEVYEETQPAINTNTFENTNEEKEFVADTQTEGGNVESLYQKEEHQNNPDSLEDIIENEDNLSHIQLIKSDEKIPQEEHDLNKSLQGETGNTISIRKRIIESTSTEEDTIAFEPLHTVDYFASQGIKIPDEALTNDKLGTQMKSFTEWLRSMKKLQPGKLPQQNSLAENIIQAAAETSNINTEVLTEAMAEVLIKQDKREKAIEMYNKLSLINPSKSAYFAAKIESIKST